MNEAEIRWIVEQIFIGNRLSRGEARLEPGRPLDLKSIRSPIIVFASWGDNITPPQQALNWIPDTYVDEHEIKIRGQRIIYMVHDKVGHLGIFVSSSIARKEHSEVTSTMKTIESLSPGLYEMVIENQTGEGVEAHFEVSFIERKMTDLRAFDDERDEEKELDLHRLKMLARRDLGRAMNAVCRFSAAMSAAIAATAVLPEPTSPCRSRLSVAACRYL